MEEQRFDTLVATIYEAAAGRATWRASLDALATAFDAPRCILTGVDPVSMRPSFRDEGGRVDPDAICEGVRSAHAGDPLLAALLHRPVGQWLYEDEMPGEHAAGRPGPVLAPAGLNFAAGLRLDDDRQAVILALARGRRRQSFDARQRQDLARLAFHFRAGLALEAKRSPRPADEAPGFEAIASNRHPLWLVDGHRRVHYRNAAAEAMRGRAGRLTEIDAHLYCVDPREDAELLCCLVRLQLGRAAPAAGQPPHRAVMRVGGADPGAYAVLLSEQPRRDAAGSPALAMVRCYPVQHSAEPDPTLVAEAFELTPAEAQVAAQLARGLSAVDIAAGRGVSTQTIRAQIRAVFEKTGINRQSDLIRLLVEMPGADPGGGSRPDTDTHGGDRPQAGEDHDPAPPR